jgi:hypothetical protein
MTAHDDTARDTANARADALLAMHARLETITAERDELAARITRAEDMLARGLSANGGFPGSPIWLDDLAEILRGNP